MKRCKACDEEFEDKFSFCPVDATPLNSLAAAIVAKHANDHGHIDSRARATEEELLTEMFPAASREFHVTMIDNTGLLERLARELRFLVQQLRQAWPAVKRDPIGFGRCAVVATRLHLGRALAAPKSLAAIATAVLVVLSAAMLLVLSGSFSKESKVAQDADRADLVSEELAQVVALVPAPNANPPDRSEARGVGAGSHGRVGFAKGKGEGSAPKPKKSTGGGAGGQHDLLPAQPGRVPPPSPIPAPIPKFPPAQKQALPVAGIDIDPAFWKVLPMAGYGDPRSKSTSPSHGPGDGGGMGTANGTGIGEGSGPGFGPGQDGNIGGDRKGPPGGGGLGGSTGSNPDPDRVYPAPEVTERARVLAKPEPQYTEDARRNQITGTVVLRVVFSRTGEVTNIRALHLLPFGLTEKAIAAARLIRFRPATKDGRPVNVYMQLEYNFNLY